MIPEFIPPREIGHVLIPDKTSNLNGLVAVLQRPVLRDARPPVVERPLDFTTRSTLRERDAYATSTKVVNLGGVDVKVYENGVVVGVSAVGSFLLILPGKGKIEGEGIGDSWSASVKVYTTHGSTPHGPYPAAIEPDPIGSFLL